MIKKAMFKEVQTFKRQGFSKSAIVKTLELDPRTVAKYYAMEEEEFRLYRQEHLFRDKAFDDLRGEILEVYGANGSRPLPVSSVYDYLEERYGALPANEQTLRNYVAYLIETASLRLDAGGRLYGKVPELPFGKQMQLDFGRYRCRSGLVLLCDMKEMDIKIVRRWTKKSSKIPMEIAARKRRENPVGYPAGRRHAPNEPD